MKKVEKIKNKCLFCGNDYEIYPYQVVKSSYCCKEHQFRDRSRVNKFLGIKPPSALGTKHNKKSIEKIKIARAKQNPPISGMKWTPETIEKMKNSAKKRGNVGAVGRKGEKS